MIPASFAPILLFTVLVIMVDQRPNQCVQAYIKYSCKDRVNGEFIQCKVHEEEGEGKKCKNIVKEEEKTSTTKCRACLKKDKSKVGPPFISLMVVTFNGR